MTKDLFNTWEIYDSGEIKNKKTGKVLKYRLRRDGYVDVKLSYKRYLVHRLLAIAFLENPNNYAQVNHINGIRNDFRLSNLEWCSQEKNMQHAITTGLFPDRKGSKNGRSTVGESEVYLIKQKLKSNESVSAIAKEIGCTIYVIYSIKRGITWKHVKP